jgi:hypothetical protein
MIVLDVTRKDFRMQNRDEKRARRQETLRRLNANEELLGVPVERSAVAGEERQRKLKNEIEIEREINRGWFFRRFGAGG